MLDITNPTSVKRLGGLSVSGGAGGLAFGGPYVYVAEANSGLLVIDVTDPARPHRVGRADIAGYGSNVIGEFLPNGEVARVALSDAFVYVIERSATPSSSNDQLHILDRHDPANPRRIGGIGDLGPISDLAVSGNVAYLSGGGLQIIDASNPSTPVLAGVYDSTRFKTSVAISGRFAYVSDFRDGIAVVDVSNPARPRAVGGYTSSQGTPMGVALAGPYAVLADGPELFGSPYGLAILDVTNPARPERVGYYSAAISVGVPLLAGGRAYAGDIVDIRMPSRPQRIGYTRAGSDSALAGQHLYMGASRPAGAPLGWPYLAHMPSWRRRTPAWR